MSDYSDLLEALDMRGLKDLCYALDRAEKHGRGLPDLQAAAHARRVEYENKWIGYEYSVPVDFRDKKTTED